jgi:DNA polymerase
VLIVAWYDTADATAGLWAPHAGEPFPRNGRVLAAHNAHGFDRFALERVGVVASAWIDTAQLARKAGLPGALDALGVRWCGVPKDKEASRFTRGLSSVRRPTRKIIESRDPISVWCGDCYAAPGEPCRTGKGKEKKRPHKSRVVGATTVSEGIDAATWRTLPPGTKRALGVQPTLDDAGFERVCEYCMSDVEIMVRAWPRLSAWREIDADVEALDRVVNDRGVAFDSQLARVLLVHDNDNAACAVARASRALGLSADAVRAAAKSTQQFCEITGSPDARADTVAQLDHPLADARKALATIAGGKLRRGLALVHADGRLRDTLRYYGAHTGRWSGRGMQLQNMPRPAPHLEGVDVDAWARDVLAGASCDADEVALGVRATITSAPGHVLVCSDFSSVEARGTAWAADDHDALATFREGRDPYKVAAVAIFGCAYDAVAKTQRQIGKVAELACGYQGGPAAFESMARVYKLDLSALDTRAIVDAWRALHAPIRSFWYACQHAFEAAARGRSRRVGPFEYVPGDGYDADSVACFMPSGRPIVYNRVHVSEDDDGRTQLSYEGVRGREHVYGGKLVENAIQALCRDLLARALVAAERAGLRPVLTVHDEIVCEVPEHEAARAYEKLSEIMIDLPTWAAGFPIGADGWIGERYRK